MTISIESPARLRTHAVQAGFLILLLVLHYSLSNPHVTVHGAIVPFTVVPVAYFSGVFGLRGAVLAAGFSAFFLLDDISHVHPAILTLEIVQIAVISSIGGIIGAAASQDLEQNRKFRSDVLDRIDRLKGSPGYWHRVAASRMGLYVTRVESTFIDRALQLDPPDTLVDIGSGSGRMEFALLRNARRVIATDIDYSELAIIEDHERLHPVRVGPAPTLPFLSNALDAVVALEVPAVSDQAWFREEAARVLRPNGAVVLTLYNAHSYKSLLSRIRAPRRESQGVKWARLYYQAGMADQIKSWNRLGFELVDAHGFYWAPLARQSNSLWVDVFSVIERILRLQQLAGLSPWILVHLRKRPDDAPTTDV